MQVKYYRRENGRIPVQLWMDTLEKSVVAGILAKMAMLEAEGLVLLESAALKHISGQKDLFELRYRHYRVLLYFNKADASFIALHGFKKQKMNERHEIATGIELADEYVWGRVKNE